MRRQRQQQLQAKGVCSIQIVPALRLSFRAAWDRQQELNHLSNRGGTVNRKLLHLLGRAGTANMSYSTCGDRGRNAWTSGASVSARPCSTRRGRQQVQGNNNDNSAHTGARQQDGMRTRGARTREHEQERVAKWPGRGEAHTWTGNNATQTGRANKLGLLQSRKTGRDGGKAGCRDCRRYHMTLDVQGCSWRMEV